VWSGREKERPYLTGLSVSEYLDSLPFDPMRRILVLSCPENFGLMAETASRIDLLGGSAYAGSPSIVRGSEEESPIDPLEAIRAIRKFGSNPTLQGGWVPLVENDAPAYRLGLETRRDSRSSFQTASELLREHPAWPALSFVRPEVEVGPAVDFLNSLLDPGWRTDILFDRRLFPLWGWLRLTPPRVRLLVENGIRAVGEGDVRAYCTLRTWAGWPPKLEGSKFHPCNFLWAKLENEIPTAEYLVESSRMFVRFVLLVWCESSAYRPEAFVPEYFFEDEMEASAFRAHWDQEVAKKNKRR
jgi:hypothetical protein